MGSSLGPVLANIIMTELENVIVRNLLADGTVAFYARYVDDTLLLIRPENVKKFLMILNPFYKSLNFSFDSFPDEVHFLDIKIEGNKTDIYGKDTHTGQYVHFTSFKPWYRKTAWIKCLVECAERICSNKHLFHNRISKIKSFMSWNGYPSYVCNVILRKLRERKKNTNGRCSNSEDDDTPKIWFRVAYIGQIGEKFAKKCISKLRKCSKKELKFILMYDTKKVAFFCSNKDPVPVNLQSHVIYQFECPGSKENILGKWIDVLNLG